MRKEFSMRIDDVHFISGEGLRFAGRPDALPIAGKAEIFGDGPFPLATIEIRAIERHAVPFIPGAVVGLLVKDIENADTYLDKTIRGLAFVERLTQQHEHALLMAISWQHDCLKNLLDAHTTEMPPNRSGALKKARMCFEESVKWINALPK